MEIAACNDDVRAIACDTFDAITPAPRCLNGCFDRLGAAAGGQSFGGLRQIGDFNQLGEKRSKLGRVVRARSDGDALRLLGQRRDQARVRMAVTDGGIRRHEIQIALAVGIPQPTAFATIDDHRNRRVIGRSETFFDRDRQFGLIDLHIDSSVHIGPHLVLQM